MEIMIFCGIYLVELVCYQLGLRLLFGLHVNISKWILIGIVMPVAIWNLPINISGKNVLVSLCVVFIMYLSMEGKVTEKGFRLGLVHLFLECMDDIFTYFFGRFLFFTSNRNIENLEYLKIKMGIVLSVFFLVWLKNKKKGERKRAHINSNIYLVLGIVVLSMMFSLGVLNYAISYLPNNKYVIFCNIINFSVHISIFLLISSVLYIKNTHERMEQLLKTERLLKESQVNYYRQILKKETDTRKYRHDMMNHLVYIYDILSLERIDDAKKYLASILGGFRKIQNTYYVIGNDMVDTIVNYFLGMLPEGVEVEIEGRCPVEIDIEDIDICTIFSNVFQNAVDEIIEHNISDAKILVSVKKGKQYVEYDIKNTIFIEINQNAVDKNGLPKSHKVDKRNHGIGMINTIEAVEKNDGKFGWYQKGGYFGVNIILPIK